MSIFEDIKLYMPKYLSDDQKDALIEDLSQFPKNMDGRFYSHVLEQEIVYQGDGIRDLLVVNFPDTRMGAVPAIVVSNTCDMDLQNERKYPTKIVYSSILNFEKYIAKLKAEGRYSKDHEEDIREQRVNSIFFLPSGSGLGYEGIVFLDRVCHSSNDALDRSDLEERRIFSLSDYGFYLLIVKLSIHFTRVKEGVQRG